MIVGKRYKYDLGSFIDKKISAKRDADEVVAAFSYFIDNDKTIVSEIQAAITKRLKYATGTLFNSISMRATYDKNKPIQSGGNEAATKKNVNISLDINTSNKSLINALLGEKEQVSAKAPDSQSLVKWINGKRRYFDEEITAIKRRQDSVRMVLQRQREDGFGASGRINLPRKESDSDKPVLILAKRIRSNMIRRLESGSPSPTAGSERVFLGNYPQYDGDKERFSFRAKYLTLETPLLTLRAKKIKGEINNIIDRKLLVHVNNIINGYDAYSRTIVAETQNTINRELEKHQDTTAKKPAGEGYGFSWEKGENVSQSLYNFLLSRYKNTIETASKMPYVGGKEFPNEKFSYNERKSSGEDKFKEFDAAGKTLGSRFSQLIELSDIIVDNLKSIGSSNNKASREYFRAGQIISRNVVKTMIPYYTSITTDSETKMLKRIEIVKKQILSMGKYKMPTKKRPARRYR